MTRRATPLAHIAAIQPYQPGKPIDAVERELGISQSIKLASNENPLGPSPRVLEAIQGGLQDLSRYPDGNGFMLKAALADFHQVQTQQITLGNGSNDVLELIARVMVSAADEVIFSEYAFAVYPLVTQAIGATARVAKAKHYGHDLEAMAQLINEKTKLIFIANPNNPTGTKLDNSALYAFLHTVPEHIVVVLDEAYVEYSTEGDESISWLAEFTNLVVTRTFSKAYGLASLRVGYSVSHLDIAEVMNRIRQPFNVNQLALLAAKAALADREYIDRAQQQNSQGMQQLSSGLQQLGLSVIPSWANFIAVDTGHQAQTVFNALLAKGVIVRPLASYGLAQFIRISIGLKTENQRCLDSLAIVLRELHD